MCDKNHAVTCVTRRGRCLWPRGCEQQLNVSTLTMKYQNTSIVRPPDTHDELFSVLHLLTGEAAPLCGVPGGRQGDDHWQLLTHTFPIVSQGSHLLYSSLHTPYCLSCLPPLPPLCLSVLTHPASKLMASDSCHAQSEPSRADAGRQGAGTETLVEG